MRTKLFITLFVVIAVAILIFGIQFTSAKTTVSPLAGINTNQSQTTNNEQALPPSDPGSFPPPEQPLKDCGAKAPKNLQMTEAAGSPAISKERAIEIARPASGLVNNNAVQVVAKYVLFTDLNFPKRKEKNIPAWVVTFCGNIRAPAGLEPENAITNHEMSVVVDARTGKLVQGFSIR